MQNLALFSKLSFLVEIDKLKQVLRVNRLGDGSRRENTAEHSWHIAMLAMTLAEHSGFDHLDLLKALKMALLHDIIEIDAGDTYAFDLAAHHDKDEREEAGARRIFGLLPEPLAAEFHKLWREFEDSKTNEARFIKAVDRMSPFMLHMANSGMVWQERGMTKSLLLTRMGEVRELCPSFFPYIERSIQEALERGWLSPE